MHSKRIRYRLIATVLLDLFLEFLVWIVAGAGERIGQAIGKYVVSRFKRPPVEPKDPKPSRPPPKKRKPRRGQ